MGYFIQKKNRVMSLFNTKNYSNPSGRLGKLTEVAVEILHPRGTVPNAISHYLNLRFHHFIEKVMLLSTFVMQRRCLYVLLIASGLKENTFGMICDSFA